MYIYICVILSCSTFHYRNDFCDFAEIYFWEFGDQVKHYITLNVPWCITLMGYVEGHFLPCRGRTQHPLMGEQFATSIEKSMRPLRV